MKTKNLCVRCEAGENSQHHNMTKEKPQHTPAPWTMSEIENSTSYDIGAKGYSIAMDVDRTNAAFIVKAVNCHESLLAFCKEFVDYFHEQAKLHPECGQPVDFISDAKKAIAYAEGK